MQQKKVAILGSGISGLTSAFYFQKKFPSVKLDIYEQNSQVGGVIQGQKFDDFFIELGPRSVRNSPYVGDFLRICENINITDQIILSETFPKAFIYYDQKFRSVPRQGGIINVLSFMKDNPRSFCKIEINKRKYKNEDDISIEQYIKQRYRLGNVQFTGLSEFLNQYLINPFLNGVYATGPEQLSYKTCFKKEQITQMYKELKQSDDQMYRQKYLSNNQKKQAQSFNFQNGIQTFTQELYNYLKNKNNLNFKFDNQIDQIEKINKKLKIQDQQYDLILSTIPSQQINKIFKQDIFNIKYNSLASINLIFKQTEIKQEIKSFGFLVPQNQNIDILGVIFNNLSFPQHSNDLSLSVMIGNEIIQKYNYDEKQLVQTAIQNVKKLLDIKNDPQLKYQFGRTFFLFLNQIIKVTYKILEIN